MIDEISLVGARMFNVINNRLSSIKHIQNNFFGGVDVIMISDFYQAPMLTPWLKGKKLINIFFLKILCKNLIKNNHNSGIVKKY